jgi:hypothetical protein
MRAKLTRGLKPLGALTAITLCAVFVWSSLPAQSQDGGSSPQGRPAAGEKASFDPQGRVLQEAKGTGQPPGAEAEAPGQFDPQGRRISAEEARALAPTGVAKACLELHNGATVTWKIDVTYNPNSYPFTITGGSIKGTICGSPNWVVTGGSMGPNLTITAKRTGGGGGCANTVTIVGHYQNPPSYAGTYGFDGASTSFAHTSVYCCGVCPP